MGNRAHTKGRDRPILFSAPMVRALIEGRKTQTRRILKPQLELFETSPGVWCDVGVFHDDEDGRRRARVTLGRVITMQKIPYAVGDRLWVREAWKAHSTFEGVKPRDIPPSRIFYLADPGYAPSGSRGRPGMFMPRWASRLTLTVTDVRVQRLQEISEEDARAEGMDDATAQIVLSPDERHMLAYAHIVTPHALSRIIFETVWGQISGADSWASNPWVAAYTFTVERRNIDASRTEEVDHG